MFGGFAPFTLWTTPPGLFPLKFLNSQRLRTRLRFVACWVWVFKKPDLTGRSAPVEKQDVGSNAGVRTKYPLGQAHDSVQVERFQQFLFECGFYPFTKQKAIRQHHGRPTGVVLEQVHDQRHEQIGRFTCLVFAWKVVLDAIFFHAAEWGIGDNDIDPIPATVILERPTESIIMPNARGYIDAVQHHVGHRQHVWQRFLFHPIDSRLQGSQIVSVVNLLLEMLNGTGKKTAGTTGRIENELAQLRVEYIHHELSHRAGCSIRRHYRQIADRIGFFHRYY
ncbi:hypothetical protein SAMN05421882_100538 [Nitrosomonas communis]|uniref:Uncharacterized protein n=1 Tax=Nitrosomonas communis TaxID=44574 RepID=A0A1H2RPJ9_9PROT|nr:hypothetical protein SAMN05421882_100538 [Nitrosomonas communis]